MALKDIGLHKIGEGQLDWKLVSENQLFLDSIREYAATDSDLRLVALANTMENFGYVFLKALEELFFDRMEQSEEITAKFMNDDQFLDAVSQHLLKEGYEKI